MATARFSATTGEGRYIDSIRLALAKLKFLNLRTSIIGVFSNHSQTTSEIRLTTEMITSVVMKRDPNQSSS
jgi:hypothetical protein